MQHFWIDPLRDRRWGEFVDIHASSSVFHTPEWLRALQQTYHFDPIVLTTSPPGQALANGIPFCRINSIFTGRRLISLPFSDHCQPLAFPEDLCGMVKAIMDFLNKERLKCVEMRPLVSSAVAEFCCSHQYYFHLLDLRHSIEEIYRRMHADCIRRKIRRAERENITSETGRSEKLLNEFYALQIATRRRLGLPPQPRQWFKNLMDAMGENAAIRVARYQGRPIASILMLKHKRTAIYKYGCSDISDSQRGGTQLILWQAIQEAKAEGMETMDLGRCNIENKGLAKFKERWGAERQGLAYFIYPASRSGATRGLGIARKILAHLPAPILVTVGRLFYRHVA